VGLTGAGIGTADVFWDSCPEPAELGGIGLGEGPWLLLAGWEGWTAGGTTRVGLDGLGEGPWLLPADGEGWTAGGTTRVGPDGVGEGPWLVLAG
jgi:hypothetical protein